MRFLRKIANFLGFVRDDHSNQVNDGDDGEVGFDGNGDGVSGTTKGFSVQVPVMVERAYQGPVMSQCSLGEGGVQGFKWYAKRLQMDEDGDVAEEFFDEVLPEPSESNTQKAKPTFRLKYAIRPAKVGSQAIAIDGNIHQSVECKGRLQWV
ncbi:hypothetical protein AMTRI_Chr13g82750 [Amborella trichopoda]|uniref:Uncharacterized protein n=1 Tax=Amborella trichopoda TaxID=13333 RepID=W1PNC7_AMBTC|nr:uncharacterized protein LOC18437452 [Amborella trichopoda]ERN09304.1 hypothetical protein AMTR_s00149p00083940 [Amborella trichopoda]|eukprot:XP_006847723.1 uncharacterized protein LOC18437452 [Amborella trichopoda]